MTRSSNKIDVYLEIGKKRTFAGALDWPGWCRSGRDEASALQALCDYGSRYGRVLHTARLGFQAPADPSAFVVRERLEGNATTDFGAPGIDVKVAWNNKQYLVCTGNSFAAPHITGITALIRAKHPELTPFQVKTVLMICAANTRR